MATPTLEEELSTLQFSKTEKLNLKKVRDPTSRGANNTV
jgi:hypothetical protein